MGRCSLVSENKGDMVNNEDKIRSVPASTTKAQVLIDNQWFDLLLIQDLVDNSSGYGFDMGNNVDDDTADSIEQLPLLEKKELAFRGARGGWYGTSNLISYCQEHLSDWVER